MNKTNWIIVWYDTEREYYTDADEVILSNVDPLDRPYRINSKVVDDYDIHWKYLKFTSYGGLKAEFKRDSWSWAGCLESDMILLRCGMHVQVRELKDITGEMLKYEYEIYARQAERAVNKVKNMKNTLEGYHNAG